jgi:uncharacterized membrane protein
VYRDQSPEPSAAARELFAERAAMARRRQALIEANPELHERELAKMEHLATALGAALGARGVEARTAEVAARTGIEVFRIAFARWVDLGGTAGLDELVTATLGELRGVVAAPVARHGSREAVVRDRTVGPGGPMP